MRLRRIMEHLKTQNWFAVALDFVIVVIGVGVAMYGQQWLSERQQRAEMALAETSVNNDLLNNYFFAKERLALTNCRAEAYQSVAAKLLASGEDWAGMPRADRSDLRATLPMVFRSPLRTWGSRIWKAGLERGTFNLMTENRRAGLDTLFIQTDIVQQLQSEVFELQARLNILAVDTTLSRSDRLRYYDVLAELDIKSASLEINAEQLISIIEVHYTPMLENERLETLKAIKRQFAESRKVYGECYLPQEFLILDAEFKKAKTP